MGLHQCLVERCSPCNDFADDEITVNIFVEYVMTLVVYWKH